MPKIRIKERDLTTNPLVGSTTNDILIVTSGILEPEEAPKLITASDLTDSESTEKGFIEDVLNLGGRVVVASTWQNALDYCGDRNQYDIKFILAKEDGDSKVPGEEETTKKELEVALEITEKRKDCVVIYTKTSKEYTSDERKWLSANVSYATSDAFFSDEQKKPVGKYVLTFYAPDENTGGLHTEDGVELDAGKGYILAFLNNIAQGRAEWLAVAGSKRGVIPNGYVVDGFLKEEEIDNMQLRTYGSEASSPAIAINPVVNMNPFGTRIWGNRTCLPNNAVSDTTDIAGGNNTDQLVASSFANIRIAICDIKKAIYKAARQYQFEQNTDVLWVNFTSAVNSLLEEMKSSYGIVGYRWKRDSANEQRGELRAILQIQPIEAIEDFTITCELKDSLDDNVQVAE